jgi:Trk K+ transport system NAD-binding subunit
MVTEMTGGYGLLVAAALAVTLSSLVQSLLSASLKYKSFYEAQVPSRPDSPSHHWEQVQITLELLRRPDLSTTLDGHSLKLIPLLSNGIPISVADGKEVRVATLRPNSPCAGKPTAAGCLGDTDDVELILILRGDRSLLPKPDVNLESGDRLVTIESDSGWARLNEHLANVEPQVQETTHETHSPVPGSVRR